MRMAFLIEVEVRHPTEDTKLPQPSEKSTANQPREKSFMFQPCNKSREEILAAIRECAARTGYHPSFNELTRIMDVSMRRIRQLFGRYSRAVQEAGVEPQGPGRELTMDQLFNDWAGVVRKVGKVPSMDVYRRHSRYSVRPLVERFKFWSVVPRELKDYAERKCLVSEWQDVIDITRTYLEKQKRTTRTSVQRALQTFVPPVLSGCPVYGQPLIPTVLATAPTNEMGVVYLFGALASKLGFIVLRMQAEFPDCEALWRVEPNRWQRVRIEFEFESKNFLRHDHDVKQCDLIVCWTHNWPACPMEVLELSKVMESPASR